MLRNSGVEQRSLEDQGSVKLSFDKTGTVPVRRVAFDHFFLELLEPEGPLGHLFEARHAIHARLFVSVEARTAALMMGQVDDRGVIPRFSVAVDVCRLSVQVRDPEEHRVRIDRAAVELSELPNSHAVIAPETHAVVDAGPDFAFVGLPGSEPGLQGGCPHTLRVGQKVI